jgi:hypothetical protein
LANGEKVLTGRWVCSEPGGADAGLVDETLEVAVVGAFAVLAEPVALPSTTTLSELGINAMASSIELAPRSRSNSGVSTDMEAATSRSSVRSRVPASVSVAA